MRRIKHFTLTNARLASYLLLIVFILGACGKKEEENKPEENKAEVKQVTLDNLMTAFNGESNAKAKYDEFAKKADEEGYLSVGSLFRAAATAEEIHATKHSEVIKSMGGEPKAEIKLSEIKTTAENLKAAIEGESYERDTMYPEFIIVAKKEGNKEALKAFNFAVEAEKQHAQLYTDALNNLEKLKAGPVEYIVCPICGHTVIKSEFEKCPVCFTEREKFINIK